jgi:hypothetical protein
MRALGWDRCVKLATVPAAGRAVLQKADGGRHQQVADAGWHTFQRAYRSELAALRLLWDALEVKPQWPLEAPPGDQQPLPVIAGSVDPSHRLPEKTAAFHDEATRFLRKWQLACLVTWDLPLPQGPLEQVPIGLARHILGPDHIGSFFPGYLDIPASQDLREELRGQQGSAGKNAGIATEFPLTDLSVRAGRASAWENAFRLWFVERAVQQRYPGRRGRTARLVEAFSTMLGCSVDRVKQLRKIYQPFLSSSLSD